MLVVDAANVVGSRPNGWWRDRGKAVEYLCSGLVDAINAGRLKPPVVVVLEGAARQGVGEHEQNGLRVVHAPRSGDDTIAGVVAQAVADGQAVTVVTADRELRDRARRVGSEVVGPRWLLDRV
ncbi:MAG: NYN domain-containing protein [Actinomycetota bacterium]|nr:NYN domain-containing protein [Actinomycetota bacterium]